MVFVVCFFYGFCVCSFFFYLLSSMSPKPHFFTLCVLCLVYLFKNFPKTNRFAGSLQHKPCRVLVRQWPCFLTEPGDVKIATLFVKQTSKTTVLQVWSVRFLPEAVGKNKVQRRTQDHVLPEKNIVIWSWCICCPLGTITLDGFQGLVFVGGFSYADVLDSAKGWAATIKFNKKVRCMRTRRGGARGRRRRELNIHKTKGDD